MHVTLESEIYMPISKDKHDTSMAGEHVLHLKDSASRRWQLA